MIRHYIIFHLDKCLGNDSAGTKTAIQPGIVPTLILIHRNILADFTLNALLQGAAWLVQTELFPQPNYYLQQDRALPGLAG